MKALVFDGKNVVLDRNYPFPERQPGEALIKVLRSGICDTDIQIVNGYMNFTGILGHEFVGQVVEADNQDLIDQRVVGEINCACGSCGLCQHNIPEHCPNRTVLGIAGRDGVFAQYCTLPEKNLIEVADSLEHEQAVFCEPLAAALEITSQVHISPVDHVLILGDGKLGALISQTIALTGCNIVVKGRHEQKLKAIRTANPSLKAVFDIDQKEYHTFDVVIDATGRAATANDAFNYVKPRGTLVIKSTVAELDTLDINRLVINEVTLIGSRCGPFEPALRLLESGYMKTEFLIETVLSLDEGEKAFHIAQKNKSKKVLIDPTK